MGMTMSEKILAGHSGKDKVGPGEYVTATIDVMMGNDVTFPEACRNLNDIGLTSFADPDKVVVCVDHFIPAMTAKHAELHTQIRKYVAQFGVKHFYDAGVGIEHTVLPEKGHAHPGHLIIGADSHSTTYGALGAAATGMGASELAYSMYKGSNWFQVPETINFVLDGQLSPGVTSKDVMLALLGQHTTDKAQYKAIEFTGSGASALSVEARMTMCNTGVEMGAKFAMFAADEKTIEYLSTRTDAKIETFGPDADAEYCETHHIDCAALEPQVAFPHNPDNVRSMSEVGDVPVQQAFIGSCTNSRTEDLEAAAKILKGRKVAPGTRLLVIPSSQEVMMNITRSGVLNVFVEAGAMIAPPGCGPCGGGSTGVLGAGENGISSTNRNFQGRMGSTEAFNHLASPETVAASAIEGKIADPRKYIG
ncbi:MAG: 3-isopropylmalate dehydratase large subunit [Rhodospirillales bacterium]|nr:3-isopropylmalate dehydratase large subunit [Rhodospirillales bacterium]